MKVVYEIINELDIEEFWMIYVILVLVVLIVVNPIVTRLCNYGDSCSENKDASDDDSSCKNSNDNSIEDKSSKVKVRKVHNSLYSKYYSHYKDDDDN